MQGWDIAVKLLASKLELIPTGFSQQILLVGGDTLGRRVSRP
jgi:hypothetical protein